LSSKTGGSLSFDVFIPTLNLAFEYQGIQHYHSNFAFAQTTEYKTRDDTKREVCNAVGITYIEVPFWWQRDQGSISAVLHNYLPSLVKQENKTSQ